MKRETQPTEEVIRKMAQQLEYSLITINRVADKLAASGDLSYAAEAIQEIVNLIMGLRLDLLITRPIREYEKILEKLEHNT